MGTMDIWYAHLDEDEFMKAVRDVAADTGRPRRRTGEKARRSKDAEDRGQASEDGRPERAKRTPAKAHTRDSLQALSKLGELVDGQYRIVSQPPIVVPVRDLAATYGLSPDEVDDVIREQFRAYRATLQDDRRHLLERFEVVDVARKVVGVGSVGTRAFIVLLQGRDADDPLFLQVKEATASVLEAHLPKSRYRQHGERVVQGQRMMQAASDIYLGWTKGLDAEPALLLAPAARHEGLGGGRGDDTGRAHVLRADLCGWTLARAHARSGDPVAIAEYLGDSDALRQVRSPTSPSATPTRTSRTTRRSSRPSGPGGWRQSKASEKNPHPQRTIRRHGR